MIKFEETFILLVFLLIFILSIDNVLCHFKESKKIKRYLALLEVSIVVSAIWILYW